MYVSSLKLAKRNWWKGKKPRMIEKKCYLSWQQNMMVWFSRNVCVLLIKIIECRMWESFAKFRDYFQIPGAFFGNFMLNEKSVFIFKFHHWSFHRQFLVCDRNCISCKPFHKSTSECTHLKYKLSHIRNFLRWWSRRSFKTM
jgi:hypothetical protein